MKQKIEKGKSKNRGSLLPVDRKGLLKEEIRRAREPCMEILSRGGVSGTFRGEEEAAAGERM